MLEDFFLHSHKIHLVTSFASCLVHVKHLNANIMPKTSVVKFQNGEKIAETISVLVRV